MIISHTLRLHGRGWADWAAMGAARPRFRNNQAKLELNRGVGAFQQAEYLPVIEEGMRDIGKGIGDRCRV
jgi:hypothetical protein